MRKLTKNLIKVICNGTFTDINNRAIPYRVYVELPDCIDEWLKSNIKNRYIKQTIRNGKELLHNNKEKENINYYDIKEILSLFVEEINDRGESGIIITDKIPSFYNKSILDFNYAELQDFAVAFGLHDIPVDGSIDDMRKKAVESYLINIEKLPKDNLRDLSFYKYDRRTLKSYIEFSERDKKLLTIVKHLNRDIEEFSYREKIIKGERTLGDVLKKQLNTDNDNNRTIEQKDEGLYANIDINSIEENVLNGLESL